jgi:hypothetical protein
MADNSDTDTLELTSEWRAPSRSSRRILRSRAVLHRPQDSRLVKYGALLATVGGGLGYFIGVRSLSGFAKELGISTSDLGIDFRDYVLFAMLSSLAIIAGVVAFYLGRLLDRGFVKSWQGDRRRKNMWRTAIAGFIAVVTLWLANDIRPDFSGSGFYEISVIFPGAFFGFLAAAYVSAGTAWVEELDARAKDRANRSWTSPTPPPPVADWWAFVVGGSVLVVLFLLISMMEDLILPLEYGLSDWPVDYANALLEWSNGESADAPVPPETLDLILTPVVVAFELDGQMQCGIRVSKNVILQEGDTIIVAEPDAFRVRGCSSDGQDFILRPGG